MQLPGKLIPDLQSDAQDFVNLYSSLGERAENFLPAHILDSLRNFARLCCEEPEDPARRHAEIDKAVLELKEMVPGYVDVSLILFPHEDSKAFQYSAKKHAFADRLTSLLDNELVDGEPRLRALNILKAQDYSIGTPPVTRDQIDLLYNLIPGEDISELRDFRNVIGVNTGIEESQWDYLMDVLDQTMVQSTHYTTSAEKRDFLARLGRSVDFKGLDGFIRTVVGGSAETVIELLSTDIFNAADVRVIEFTNADDLYERIKEDRTGIFIVKAGSMRKNVFNDIRWFSHLTRIIIVDDSPQSRSTNTTLVFGLHNKVIDTLNKVQTKKLGALANTQLNLRLILEMINDEGLERFRAAAERKIVDYEAELEGFRQDQLGGTGNRKKDIGLFKFNEYSRRIIRDKYALTKLRDYLALIRDCRDPARLKKLNRELIREFEARTRAYFYSNIEQVHIATIVEGGGRGQIRMYGMYLLERRLKPIAPGIVEKCRTIMDIIPNTCERTLRNHYHKNFGLNLFLERYKDYITKVENESDNQGRFTNLLIDLGIADAYRRRTPEEQLVIREFTGGLSNLDLTSLADDVQMVIRDLLFNASLKPYILFNTEASWEYKDLFPVDRFDLNPFDLEVGLDTDKRIDFERLSHRLTRIKNTFQLFDDTGTLWDRFCENLTIIINDPSNPSGYTDFNDPALIRFLKFLNNNKITLLLDEAYSDSVKVDDPEEPKWRSISRYVMNNISSLPNISIVSSLSTTKNLGATGSRLGSLMVSPARKDVTAFARAQHNIEKGNTNSLFMLVNVIEAAQLSKKIKDNMESELPKDASRYRIKALIENYIITELESYEERISGDRKNVFIKRFSPFEGSPLHIFLLEELISLDKLDVLGLPDDFKYKGEPFFKYYQDHIVREINTFRVNKLFRRECGRRLRTAKNVAAEVIRKMEAERYFKVIDSDGSYLFNVLLKEFFSYQDLEKFTKKLSEQRGVSAIPYPAGFLRFSLGGYIEGTEESYAVFAGEFENALRIVFKYWILFQEAKTAPKTKDMRTEDILDDIFRSGSEMEFFETVLADFDVIRDLNKSVRNSLTIGCSGPLYRSFPSESGVSISTLHGSGNSVLEFRGATGTCPDLRSFIRSKAFTVIYEGLLPGISGKIPALKGLDADSIAAKYGKAVILKYIENKLGFQPNSHVLDDPDEKNVMKEILIELERALFSDSRFKVLALDASDDQAGDKARLEGVNSILRKHIEELLMHFNLPFGLVGAEPTIRELVRTTVEKFEEIVGKSVEELNLPNFVSAYSDRLTGRSGRPGRLTAWLDNGTRRALDEFVPAASLPAGEKLLRLYLLRRNGVFEARLKALASGLAERLAATDGPEARMFAEDFAFGLLARELDEITASMLGTADTKITQEELHREARAIGLMLIEIMNRTRSTGYYSRYNHTLIKFIETAYRTQNSSINEMIQHGITIHRNFEADPAQASSEAWIPRLMARCGVIGLEQTVQAHTRIVTDAKRRVYPYHKADRDDPGPIQRDYSEPHEYLKNMDIKPVSAFFIRRLEKFMAGMDPDDFRCKIIQHGLVKVLYVFHKCYIKYLADNYRLLQADEVRLEDVRSFVPDVFLFFGAPEKVLSFPRIGYFDLPGPHGSIKTLVTPLKKEVDYFGNIKKPWLTMLNEKVKDMGGIPVHGSLFAIEEEDGAIFVVQVSGDSGVGKSEMLAAMILKWLKKDLSGVRSIKMIAADMFFLFPDREGNLYGVGTEEGDFSRVTDYDPDFIKYYKSLFAKAADSNPEDLNSRSTISGMCDITMPFRIDVMLTAGNFGRAEAGITRYANPENFLLYRDSHGERKEKATSSDNPHIQRTLLRYTGDRNIVDVLDKYGNSIDDVLDWEWDGPSGKYFLCASYKLIDKIDLEDVVNRIFAGKTFRSGSDAHLINRVDFDIIRNRFVAQTSPAAGGRHESARAGGIGGSEFLLDKGIFMGIFNALASTPSGQPFVAEEGQLEAKKHLVGLLKGGHDGRGKGRNIRLGILSTDLGRKGKEITGPQAAAEDMKAMLQEVRVSRNDINAAKDMVQRLVHEKYAHIFNGPKRNSEVCRHNFVLYQVQRMKKASFVRMDDPSAPADLSGIKGFEPVDPDAEFSPLLVTPNIDIELSAYTETYRQLMTLPSNPGVADDFYEDADKLNVPAGYGRETTINDLVLQLLILSGCLTMEDITRGRITEKVNRETLAAARAAADRKLEEREEE